VNRWLAMLSPVTTFGVLNGRDREYVFSRKGEGDSASEARRFIGLNRWETEWAANGGDLLRILKAL
jgi:hypothetical protein